ncbi:hypothetical protein [Bradyrhizobium sp. AUGA SZCCT0160]|uniref:hypothetical protein n=1 Tax=Bradyrhizobium sp. AUGA SZCCT0160 TaxID=2807662 RepID=UPI001BAA56CB|nr:hypothetical protein [Bradyrhizobium sp. AUGA SZCCT0160]MBR1188852.1 hypothetical protein [Bradyrhizobium sp. AUGA SZCCT0160]
MAIRIGEVKSSRLSDDKKEVIVDGSGKYIGDVELKIARECLDDFIDALVSARGKLGSVAVPAGSAVGPKLSARSGGNLNEVRFEIPKTFAVTADTEGRGPGPAYSQSPAGKPGRLCAVSGCRTTSGCGADQERGRIACFPGCRRTQQVSPGM